MRLRSAILPGSATGPLEVEREPHDREISNPRDQGAYNDSGGAAGEPDNLAQSQRNDRGDQRGKKLDHHPHRSPSRFGRSVGLPMIQRTKRYQTTERAISYDICTIATRFGSPAGKSSKRNEDAIRRAALEHIRLRGVLGLVAWHTQTAEAAEGVPKGGGHGMGYANQCGLLPAR